jgi:energy-converting hydrogenase Eha subunit A
MNGDRAAVHAYRSLTCLYPRAFRHQYREDLVQLFREQCRDEPAARVCARATVDLLITIPGQHLESRMNRTSNAIVPVFFLALALAGLLLAVLGGSEPAPFFVGLSVAAGAGLLAAVSWRRAHPTPEVSWPAIAASWWKFLGTGAVLLAVGGLQNQFEFGNWYVWILMVMSAFVLAVTGLVLGLVQLVMHRPRRPSTV